LIDYPDLHDLLDEARALEVGERGERPENENDPH
jgi:hypothetical protein